MLVITPPPPCPRMTGTKALQVRHIDRRLRSMIRS
jgi:hypothetical protein